MLNVLSYCLTLLLGCLIICPGCAAEPYREFHFTVVPGKSAGPIRLAQPIPRDFVKKLGPPSKTSAQSLAWSRTPDYPDFCDGVLIKWDRKGLVHTIILANVPFQTARGLKMGDTRLRTLKTYPEGSHPLRSMEPDTWEIEGCAFDFYKDKLFRVIIHDYANQVIH